MTLVQQNQPAIPIWNNLRAATIWQLAERSTRIGLGFAFSIIIARTLGPSAFGIYSYALAVIAIFAFLSQAGLDALLLRELVRQPEQNAQRLSEGLALRAFGAILAGLASIATVLFAAPNGMQSATLLVAILSLSGLFQAGWVVESWLQARDHFKHAAITKIVAYSVSALCRLLALYLPYPLLGLAVVAVAESALCALLMWQVSTRYLSLRLTSLHMPDTRNLLNLVRLASPMLLSALCIAVYSRIDVFMLGQMVGSDAAGLYTAGSLLSEGFYLIPMALMAASAPRLATLFNQDTASFEREMYRLLRILSAAGLMIALTVTWLAPFVVPRLFGSEFQASTGILQIHIWSTWIVFVSSASDPWYINHDLRRLYLAKTAIAAILNIVLNFIMIPLWQGEGAALATLISYTISAIIIGALWPQTRPLFRMQIRAILGFGAKPMTRQTS